VKRDKELALHVLKTNSFGLVKEDMKKEEQLPLGEQIKALKLKRMKLYDQYNGILAGVAAGNEVEVGLQIHRLNERITKLQEGSL